MKENLKKWGARAAVAVILMPYLALAQGAPPTPPAPFKDVAGFGKAVCNVFNFLFFTLVLVAIILAISAAFKYATSAGDPEKVKGASHTLLYAGVAILVAVVAKAVPFLVASITGTTAIGAGFGCA